MSGEMVNGTCKTFRVKIHTVLRQINETLPSSFKPNTHDLQPQPSSSSRISALMVLERARGSPNDDLSQTEVLAPSTEPLLLVYIVLSTRDFSPGRPAAVLSTTWREKYSFPQIFKGHQQRITLCNGAGLYQLLHSSSEQTSFTVIGR